MPKKEYPPVPSQELPPVLLVLTTRERVFSEYMALYDDAHKAAKLAGYSSTTFGYSLVHKPEVAAAIAYFKMVFAEASQSTPSKIIREMSLIAHTDITEFFYDDWTLKPKKELSPELRRALVGLEVIPTKYGLRAKPKFAKVEALFALGRMFGLDDAGRQEEVAPGTTVHINVGSREMEEKDVTPTTVQIGNLTIVAREKQEE